MLILLETMAEERRLATAPEILEPLMAQLAGGNQETLAELYHRCRASVYGLALSYLKNRHDAEDITQDTFVRVWENAGQYRSQGTPLAWLLTITRNLALMKLRERGRIQDMEPEDWERLAADNPMVTVEDRHVLEAALTALADDERQIVILHAVTGWKHREIAQLLELPLSTVLSKYRRALAKLKTKLEGGNA
ncbi:MAG TPA: RNA polymerase sigma factor [Candidatus Flavonifractor avicola]|nr:RNA polymerase sigma factor [Candidatus Flavonifractor avicola]